MKNIRPFVYTAVVVAGAAVLGIEILGTRVLGPFYGVSVFLWSTLITVTLAALAAGYFVGGSLADRNPAAARLSAILAAAGLWSTLIPWLQVPAVELFEPLGLRAAVVGSALLLFFPPLLLLGMVAPFAIRLMAPPVEEIGRVSGRLYALSTLAGVLSGLGTTLALIPRLGTSRSLLAFGGCLLLTAVWGTPARRRAAAVAALLVVATAVVAIAMLRSGAGGGTRELARVESPYAEIRVVDAAEGRHLLIDGAIHTLADTAAWGSRLHYAWVMELPRYFVERPGRMLLIGLGGGSLARRYHEEGWTVDAVEIDEEVARAARAYFGLRDDEARLHIADGRDFLRRSKDRYDVILLDAYGSGWVPFHLLTREAFALMASRLDTAGVLAVNLISAGWDSRLVRSVAATMRRRFQDVQAFPIAEPPNRVGNIVLMASKSGLMMFREPERDYLDPEFRFGPKYQRVHAFDNRFFPSEEGAVVVTDELNPLDVMSEAASYEGRKELREYMRAEGIALR